MGPIDSANFHSQGLRPEICRSRKPNPVLALLRRLLVDGFECAATDLDADGDPTQDALDAEAWILADTDWTKHCHRIPPKALRAGHVLSFEYCCFHLNLQSDHVRQFGPPPPVQVTANLRLRVLKQGSYITPGLHVAGMPAVYAIRESRRAEIVAAKRPEKDEQARRDRLQAMRPEARAESLQSFAHSLGFEPSKWALSLSR